MNTLHFLKFQDKKDENFSLQCTYSMDNLENEQKDGLSKERLAIM